MPKKVFFLIQRWNKPSSRYRVLQYLPYLEAAGIETKVEAISGRVRGRWSTLQKASQAHILFVQKKLFSRLELYWLLRKGARFVYDFDDAVMLRHSPREGSFSPGRARSFAATVKRAHLVLAGNHFLEHQAKPLAQKVVFLPTTLDTAKYAVKKSWASSDTLTLGWLGSPSTLQYLEQILPAVREVCRRYPQVRLKVVSSRFPKGGMLPIEAKIWNEKEEVSDLLTMDIGLAPLAQDLWCEGKCGLKLLQYMACGLPSVASPWGAQIDIVEDGINGFWAASAKEWVEKLSLLIEKEELRKQLGLAARQTVEQKYALTHGAAILKEVLLQVK